MRDEVKDLISAAVDRSYTGNMFKFCLDFQNGLQLSSMFDSIYTTFDFLKSKFLSGIFKNILFEFKREMFYKIM
jgi:hypothetical protein